MGWLISHDASKKDIIAERIKTRSLYSGWDKDAQIVGECVTLRHTLRGNVLWTVRESRYQRQGESPELKRWIGCDLLGTDGQGNWGYKDMDESVGPYEVSCPLAYLEMVPDPCTSYSTDWRNRVRAYHARAKAVKVKVGDRVRLQEGCTPQEVVITSVRPLRGVANFCTYRIKRKHLAEVVSEQDGQAQEVQS